MSIRDTASPTPDDQPAAAEPLQRVVFRPAVLVPLGAALISLARLHQMTGFNLGLTVTVLQVVDQAQLLLTTLLGGATFIALAGVAASTALVTHRLLPVRGAEDRPLPAHRPAVQTRTSLVMFGTGVPVLVVMLPAASLLIIASIMAAAIAVTALNASSQTMRRRSGARARVLVVTTRVVVAAPVVALGALLAYGMLFAVPLRTPERVTTDAGVYDSVWVMGEQSQQTLLLNDQQEARWVDTGSITSRQICGGAPTTHRALSEPLPRLLGPPRRSTNLLDYAPCTS